MRDVRREGPRPGLVPRLCVPLFLSFSASGRPDSGTLSLARSRRIVADSQLVLVQLARRPGRREQALEQAVRLSRRQLCRVLRRLRRCVGLPFSSLSSSSTDSAYPSRAQSTVTRSRTARSRARFSSRTFPSSRSLPLAPSLFSPSSALSSRSYATLRTARLIVLEP